MNGNWNWDTFFDALPMVLEGIGITIGLTFACYLFALIFGFLWIFLRRIPVKSLNWIITWIMEFIRSTPPLVQLFFIFYAWPMVPVIGMALDPFTSAVLGLGIHFSTYIGEVYRSGIEGVDKGQWEASTALNFSIRQKWTKIILPQAIPPAIPMLGNYLIIMFKEVPLASTIGVVGILHMANSYGAQHWAYLEPLTIVAILFLILSYPSAILINKLEKKMNRRFDKKAIVKNSKGAVM
ncbi:ectoine/hydroxyectoine ABC transporter permease subunit EhuD [Virgibacillus indicus]|uniref:Ectoine/hydroxyectoine ABC transporter permease subunit EhuD n=1 Tax=Virgibacillus indicus TaxID=2024554 RepID=A0A265N7X0_9BACI|nr:ectoine/hydroxyectoine ABC transporter permease subunit EhuD [Virgibacillus indicus]OZU88102.1 ectoine/hydroxyectoine ABC transporter permease subunit EhuD [Virgibacillus indicus]